MSKKVFRIHKQGSQNNDWFNSTEINSSLIDSIVTDGGDGKKLPTSIPSPFARIDLVRTAFSIVADSGNLDGVNRNGRFTSSDNHKLISDALDIGQILFNYNKHNSDLQLVAWDRTQSLNKLLNGNPSQKHLGETLNLFLKQDELQYNFNKVEKIYILKYKYKIIGGTSSRTLFFAAPNIDEIGIKFGNDTMLDEGLCPLYKRDKDYVKYLFALTKTQGFNTYFPEFNGYIIKTIEKIHDTDSSFHDELMNLDCEDYLGSMENVLLNNNAGEPIEIINGLPVKQYVLNPSIIQKNSDLTISSNAEIKGFKPLVLPVAPFNLSLRYTTDVWNSQTQVPVEDQRPLSQRTLPEQGDLYPYLTMNDFLTESIIKLPYEIDTNKFFAVGESKYLLPLTELFFNYFSVDDLNNKNMLQLHARAGDSVEVKLTIPVYGGSIEYSKIYYPKISDTPKKGSIVEKSFGLSIFPFVVSDDVAINYAIGIADVNPETGNDLSVSVQKSFDASNRIDVTTKERCSSPLVTKQTIVNDNFDAIAIKYGNSVNYLIPSWPNYKSNGGDNYMFSIDFGTTNSHIEFKIEGEGSEKAYEITEKDSQIAFLMPRDVNTRSQAIRDVRDGENYLEQETISEKFGKGELRNAPFRTCLIENKDVNYNKSTSVFADANAGFDYEKTVIRKYLKAFTDLKWATDDANKARLNHYIEELLTLCKNKVLVNNGNINNTSVTWFYPVSMSSNQLNKLRRIWKAKFKEVFGAKISVDNLIDYPESIAPFYYYKAKENLKALARPSVSVDIGGGTTDIMVYTEGEPVLISSFKFAGNAIFGDAFNGNINNNGFVKKYHEEFKNILNENKLKIELEILEKLFHENHASQDLINFLFSLNGNKNIKDAKLSNLNFSEKLADDSDLKIIFLLFYASIMYHIAELMKCKNLDIPRNIVFSGTSSKSLQILDQDTSKYSSVTALFEAIFNNVYGETDANISIKTNDNPKEVTCKGGFYMKDAPEALDHTKLIGINIGSTMNNIQGLNTVSETTVTYKDVDKKYLSGVIDNVENFFTLFNKLMQEMNFKNSFDVSNKSIELFNKIKSEDLLDYEMQGVESLKADATEEDPLGETLFFFPLIGKLNELANEISSI